MQPFCHFKINNFILKTKSTPNDNYEQFFSKTDINKYGLPNLTKLIQGDLKFFSYRKHTNCTYFFIYKQILPYSFLHLFKVSTDVLILFLEMNVIED